MPTLREVRSRISGVKKTEKITRAMKMVAAAKLRRAQMAAVELGSQPLLTPRPVRTLALIVVTSDRGMCGAFNTNIIRTARERLERAAAENVQVRLYCLGKKGVDFFTKQRAAIVARHPGLFTKLVFAQAASIAREVTDAFLRQDVDCVEVVYNEFKSAVQQRVLLEQYLPIVPDASDPAITAAPRRVPNYIYEPSQQELLTGLLPRYLNFTLWRILLESSAAEEGSRMTAMENATENANEMIDTLQLQYNKARQAAITKELLEVVSGADAQRNAS